MAEHRRTDENLDDGRAARPGSARPQPPRAEPAQRRPDTSRPANADTAADSAADPGTERDRQVRRARFLAELDEARELRKRVAPRRTRAAELHARVLRTFRY